MKKRLKEKKPKMDFNEDETNKYKKYFIGAAIYLAVAAGVYEIKKERALPLTHQELLLAIKKGEVTQILIVRELKGKEQDTDE